MSRARLDAEFTPRFKRDFKAIAKKRDMAPLCEVMELILTNDAAFREELTRRHDAHRLFGKWVGSNECHVCNMGDWLLIWAVRDGLAVFQRMGSHDELFRSR